MKVLIIGQPDSRARFYRTICVAAAGSCAGAGRAERPSSVVRFRDVSCSSSDYDAPLHRDLIEPSVSGGLPGEA
jgi:hypothetical protein